MARKSRDPQSAAVVHEMSPEAQTAYERMKRGYTGVVGWARDRDPWGWSDGRKATDPWQGRDRSNSGIWPPDVEVK